MRILLATTLLKNRNFQPLALEHLSAILKQAGFNTRLADTGLYGSFEKQIAQFRPDVIGYYATTGAHVGILESNAKAKSKFDFFSIFGGPHPTYFPEMIENPGVDAICRGEGEGALLELVQALEAGGQPSGIDNLWIKTPNGIEKNDLRPLLEDLDSLPILDGDLIQSVSYCRDFPVKMFMASRGCPYSCNFCYNPAYRELYKGQKIYRRKSPERVIDEVVDYKKRFHFQYAYFCDDIFGLDQNWLREFCDLYKEKVDTPFYSHFRADVINDETIRLMKQAGLAYAGIGVESGTEQIRNDVLNKCLTDERLLNASELLRKHSIPFATFNMIGIPGTTLEDDVRTLQLNWKLRPHFAEALMFMPYPKTGLGDIALAEGLYSGDPDQLPTNFKRPSPMRIEKAHERKRLLFLFTILGQHPMPDSMLNRLLNLPLGPLYRLISRIHDGYTKIFGIYRVRFQPKLFLKLTWHYLRY